MSVVRMIASGRSHLLPEGDLLLAGFQLPQDTIPFRSVKIYITQRSIKRTSSALFVSRSVPGFRVSITGKPYKLPGDHPIRSLLLLKTSDSDRKSTRLNSSHVAISYAVFCLKKKIK